eukprot:12315020-Alexandrium_andersonii.AAC.1
MQHDAHQLRLQWLSMHAASMPYLDVPAPAPQSRAKACMCACARACVHECWERAQRRLRGRSRKQHRR